MRMEYCDEMYKDSTLPSTRQHERDGLPAAALTAAVWNKIG
jgi:hypothetical protein